MPAGVVRKVDVAQALGFVLGPAGREQEALADVEDGRPEEAGAEEDRHGELARDIGGVALRTDDDLRQAVVVADQVGQEDEPLSADIVTHAVRDLGGHALQGVRAAVVQEDLAPRVAEPAAETVEPLSVPAQDYVRAGGVALQPPGHRALHLEHACGDRVHLGAFGGDAVRAHRVVEAEALHGARLGGEQGGPDDFVAVQKVPAQVRAREQAVDERLLPQLHGSRSGTGAWS